MVSGWVVLGPALAHLSRHKWLLGGNAWYRVHQWGAYGLSLITFIAALVAFLNFGKFGSSHMSHAVGGTLSRAAPTRIAAEEGLLLMITQLDCTAGLLGTFRLLASLSLGCWFARFCLGLSDRIRAASKMIK